jgi:hypothetical protein
MKGKGELEAMNALHVFRRLVDLVIESSLEVLET